MADISAILSVHNLRDFLPVDCLSSLRMVSEDRYRGRCPICESSDGLSVFLHRDGHEVFNCFSCNERGCVIDLYAKTNNVTIRQAIVDLSVDGSKAPSTEVRLTKAADAARAKEGKFLLCCVRCPATRQVADDLSAAILMDGGSNWEVAPDGIAAICPKCLGDANQIRFDGGRRASDSHRQFIALFDNGCITAKDAGFPELP